VLRKMVLRKMVLRKMVLRKIHALPISGQARSLIRDGWPTDQ